MKVKHFTFITSTLAVLMLLVGFFIVEANAIECYYSRVLCTGWCSLSSYCVPAPTSLTNIGGCTLGLIFIIMVRNLLIVFISRQKYLFGDRY